MTGALMTDAPKDRVVSPVASETANIAPEAERFWSCSEPQGESYHATLARLHAVLEPKTYLEIGVDAGGTLKLANCATIGVDPNLRNALTTPFLGSKHACHLFGITSDTFFSGYDPTRLFGQPIDMAFLDGMHLFEFLLRDFINTERHCQPTSIVCLHDCIPADSHVGRRDVGDSRWKGDSRYPHWWAGDVWKTVLVLKKYRPDLQTHVFDAAPTGLVVVTGLNPASTVLNENYSDIVRDSTNLTLDALGDDYLATLHVLETKHYLSKEAICKLFLR
jgi:hypothetical protein